MKVELKVETGERQIEVVFDRDFGEYHPFELDGVWSLVHHSMTLIEVERADRLRQWLKQHLAEITTIVRGAEAP